MVLHILDLFGTAIFAITGVLAARNKRFDLFGCVVLGFVTALGGGTFRDIVLGGAPVFWVKDISYILVVLLFSIMTFWGAGFFVQLLKLILIFDAFGLAFFTVIGLQKSILMGNSWLVSIIMGVITGVFGGIIRDLLTSQVPLILRREIYATASLCGAVAYIIMQSMIDSQIYVITISMSITFVIRFVALRFNISLPLLKY